MKIIQRKYNFLDVVSEKEGLNKKIAINNEFDLKTIYILEYNEVLENLISYIKTYLEKI
ncbi:hypothetical protein LRB67_05175 [Borreliella bissettiae]|uniref:hypothetical protein n=1 Tax=Borrelia bissettiae TaxID=64897 RepID=UPI001E3FE98A|nr:hypothetical protein [Borreliella bissettiae]MCD2401645.1 hypothetical protein [Borreliella bissettiae]